jgi:hypothetical protein
MGTKQRYPHFIELYPSLCLTSDEARKYHAQCPVTRHSWLLDDFAICQCRRNYRERLSPQLSFNYAVY